MFYRHQLELFKNLNCLIGNFGISEFQGQFKKSFSIILKKNDEHIFSSMIYKVSTIMPIFSKIFVTA